MLRIGPVTKLVLITTLVAVEFLIIVLSANGVN